MSTYTTFAHKEDAVVRVGDYVATRPGQEWVTREPGYDPVAALKVVDETAAAVAAAVAGTTLDKPKKKPQPRRQLGARVSTPSTVPSTGGTPTAPRVRAVATVQARRSSSVTAGSVGGKESGDHTPPEEDTLTSQFLSMVEEHAPVLSGARGTPAGIMGIVRSVDERAKAATVELWRRGEKILKVTGKPAVSQTLPLSSLVKLPEAVFAKHCKQPYLHDARYKWSLVAAGDDDSTPTALVAYNNALVADLIDRIDTSVQRPADPEAVREATRNAGRKRPMGDVKRTPTPRALPVADPLADVRDKLRALADGPLGRPKARADRRPRNPNVMASPSTSSTPAALAALADASSASLQFASAPGTAQSRRGQAIARSASAQGHRAGTAFTVVQDDGASDAFPPGSLGDVTPFSALGSLRQTAGGSAQALLRPNSQQTLMRPNSQQTLRAATPGGRSAVSQPDASAILATPAGLSPTHAASLAQPPGLARAGSSLRGATPGTPPPDDRPGSVPLQTSSLPPRAVSYVEQAVLNAAAGARGSVDYKAVQAAQVTLGGTPALMRLPAALVGSGQSIRCTLGSVQSDGALIVAATAPAEVAGRGFKVHLANLAVFRYDELEATDRIAGRAVPSQPDRRRRSTKAGGALPMMMDASSDDSDSNDGGGGGPMAPPKDGVEALRRRIGETLSCVPLELHSSEAAVCDVTIASGESLHELLVAAGMARVAVRSDSDAAAELGSPSEPAALFAAQGKALVGRRGMWQHEAAKQGFLFPSSAPIVSPGVATFLTNGVAQDEGRSRQGSLVTTPRSTTTSQAKEPFVTPPPAVPMGRRGSSIMAAAALASNSSFPQRRASLLQAEAAGAAQLGASYLGASSHLGQARAGSQHPSQQSLLHTTSGGGHSPHGGGPSPALISSTTQPLAMDAAAEAEQGEGARFPPLFAALESCPELQGRLHSDGAKGGLGAIPDTF